MAVKYYCFLVKRLELGYVFYIIKHATKTDKDVFTKLRRTWKIYFHGNEESTIHIFFVFDRSFDILASEIEVLVFAKNVRKTFGKQSFILAVK